MIKPKYKYHALLIIFVIGLIASTILTLTPVPPFCNKLEGCNVVQSSKYAIFMGIKNSTYGIGIFLFLILITTLHMKTPRNYTKHAIHLSVILGSAIALYFLYLQQFILKMYCVYCIIVDLGILIGLVIIILYWKR